MLEPGLFVQRPQVANCSKSSRLLWAPKWPLVCNYRNSINPEQLHLSSVTLIGLQLHHYCETINSLRLMNTLATRCLFFLSLSSEKQTKRRQLFWCRFGVGGSQVALSLSIWPKAIDTRRPIARRPVTLATSGASYKQKNVNIPQNYDSRINLETRLTRKGNGDS